MNELRSRIAEGLIADRLKTHGAVLVTGPKDVWKTRSLQSPPNRFHVPTIVRRPLRDATPVDPHGSQRRCLRIRIATSRVARR
jgi:hypothetical protein